MLYESSQGGCGVVHQFEILCGSRCTPGASVMNASSAFSPLRPGRLHGELQKKCWGISNCDTHPPARSPALAWVRLLVRLSRHDANHQEARPSNRIKAAAGIS